mgnify:CR=1 FL=1
MDKLVYLHELDSVRTSPQEVAVARRALYEEIVLNGNTVVLTFNQLADSRAFLGLAMESEEMLSAIKGLMLCGAIKISRFGDKRTASQYLQDNLRPSAAGSHGKFVLSGWNIPAALNIEARERMRDGIYRALRNSDTAYLDSLLMADDADISALCEPGKTLGARQYREAVAETKRLVDLMLAISNSPLSYVDVNLEARPALEDAFRLVREGSSREASVGAWDVIDDVRANLAPADRQARSAYYRHLKALVAEAGSADEASDRCVAEEALQLVDLCYNLTTEASVLGVSAHYVPANLESIADEARQRIKDYRESYATLGHRYPWLAEEESDESSSAADAPSLADWKHALRIRRASVKAAGEPAASVASKPVLPYEAQEREQKDAWRARVTKALWRNVLVMLLYAVILGFVEVIVSLIQDMLVGWLNIANDTVGDLVSDQGSIASIFVFLAGVAIFSRSKGGPRAGKALIVFLAALFFVALPILSCMSVGVGPSGLIWETSFESLPDTLMMGLPSLAASFIGVGIFAYVGWLFESKLEMPGIVDSAAEALSSLRDLSKFAKEGSVEPVAYVNPRTRARFGEAGNAVAVAPSAWEGAFGFAPASSKRQSSWEKYLAVVESDSPTGPPDSEGPAALRIVTDRAAVLRYEASAEGRPIGIAYSSPYNQLLVDLAEDGQGRRFAYERVVPAAKNAVVIVPRFEGDFVLLRQFRHALRDYQLCFPRGYGEPGISARDNAEKELFEELKVRPLGPMRHLGSVVADSGLSGGRVEVFACDVPAPSPDAGYEEIDGCIIAPPTELEELVADGRINDGFTLSALTLLRCGEV